jgi:SAM-dependent methyltransferase
MEPTDENLRAFEDAHRAAAPHERRLPSPVRASLSDLHDKRVLHLVCGTGAQTVEFAELGASVTGVDASEAVLEAARARGPSVLWIQGRADAVPTELQRGRFDLVYLGEGGLDAVVDLYQWAGGVAAALRPGGDLLVFDAHPVAGCVDDLMHWRGDYFAPGSRRLGNLVPPLVHHALQVRALEEYPAGVGRKAQMPAAFLLHARKS